MSVECQFLYRLKFITTDGFVSRVAGETTALRQKSSPLLTKAVKSGVCVKLSDPPGQTKEPRVEKPVVSASETVAAELGSLIILPLESSAGDLLKRL